MRKLVASLVFATALARAPAALAGEPDAPGRGKAHVGLLTGVFLPQLASELGTAFGIELEGGVRVWRRLAPTFSVAFSQPPVTNARDDPRLTGGSYVAATTQRELTFTVGAYWWFLPEGRRLNAYAGLGARLYLLETITNGSSGGMPFLENRETSSRFGGVATGGGEYRLGPGAAVLQLALSGSDLPHLVTGDVATTGLSATVGYRLFF